MWHTQHTIIGAIRESELGEAKPSRYFDSPLPNDQTLYAQSMYFYESNSKIIIAPQKKCNAICSNAHDTQCKKTVLNFSTIL